MKCAVVVVVVQDSRTGTGPAERPCLASANECGNHLSRERLL
jgi:hypothetical protein